MALARATRPVLLLALAALLAWYALRHRALSPDAFSSLALGGVAPVFSVPLLVPGALAPSDVRSWQAGKLVSLDGHRGAPVVLDFWGTWCEPCVVGRPAVAALARRYANHGVVVYGISYREAPDHALKWLEKHGGATCPELRDEGGQVARTYLVHGVPQMYLVGPDGRLRWHCFGCDSLPEHLYPILDSLLGVSGRLPGS
jgi:thiol-disulfide isomerase/thioredoxin